jgi:hypothetical protein
MRILISIDDTDNLESRGTGELASLIAEELQENGWGRADFVTRHQLLVHPDIPYTSHNSAMCFSAEIAEGSLEKVIAHAGAFLQRESAPEADPGLCVAVLDRLTAPDRLLTFGYKAKEKVLDKEEAYALAASLGLHLSEHGGTGQGIIGALAGAGLRLGGNDGRLKGSIKVPGGAGLVRVRELRELPEVDRVATTAGILVPDEDLVRMGEKPKTVMHDGGSVLLVSAVEPDGSEVRWQTLHRKELRGY